MSKKTYKKKLLSDSILLNVIAIGLVGILLVILTLLFMNVYTRHGHNVVVPDLKGLQAQEAKSMLKSKGLNVLIIDSIFSANGVPGSIIDQTPKPSNNVKSGRNIYITVYSFNPQEISIPDLVDFSSRQAMSLLNSIGFNDVEIIEKPAEYSGLVLSVEYKGRRLLADEQIPLGHPIKLIVGKAVDSDSLSVNQELNLAPSDIKRNVSEGTGSESTSSIIDDSFF